MRTIDELRAATRTLVTDWLDAGRFEPRSDSWLRSFDPEFSAAMADRGLIGLTWPIELGGGGLSNTARLAVTEELLRAGAPVAAHWMGDRQIGPAIVRHGSKSLQEELLPGILRGQSVYCLGMSEPGAGSDLASVSTRARKEAGGWRIDGHKIWTSHAHRASHIYVLARTSDEETKHDGLTEFIIDMNSPGIIVDPILDMAGEHHFNEVHFNHVLVPHRRVLGDVGAGWSQIVGQLAFERGGPERVLSSYRALAELVAHARTSQDPGLPEVIGSLAARLSVLRRMCWAVARAMDTGTAPVVDAASLKLLGNEFENDVVEAARRLPGHSVVWSTGVLGDATVAAPAFGLRGGASDVLRSIIVKQEVAR